MKRVHTTSSINVKTFISTGSCNRRTGGVGPEESVMGIKFVSLSRGGVSIATSSSTNCLTSSRKYFVEENIDKFWCVLIYWYNDTLCPGFTAFCWTILQIAMPINQRFAFEIYIDYKKAFILATASKNEYCIIYNYQKNWKHWNILRQSIHSRESFSAL